MERFIVSARKYRPDTFETLVGQESIAITLKNSILRNQLAHAYLFCGPRGVGKTSSARIFAKTINCLKPGENMTPCGECESCVSFAEGRSYSIHELDAASNNSVDDIRQLNELVRIPPQIGKYSVYIIDEVHMLSSSAFNAFLKTLEEPPAHAIFILATTEKHKILPTILSRCQTYDFNRISVEDIVRKLQAIAEKEGIEIEIEALHIIAQKADGAMRDALTIFDQAVAFCGKKIEYERVISALNVLDYDYYIRLTNHFLKGEYSESLLIFDEILSKGFNSLHFIGGLSTHFRDLLISKDKSTAKLLELAPSVIDRYKEQSDLCSLNFLYDALSITSACEAGYKASGHQRLHIEFALLKLCRISCVSTEQRAENQQAARASQKAATPQATNTQQVTSETNQSAIVEAPLATTEEAKQPIVVETSLTATEGKQTIISEAPQSTIETGQAIASEASQITIDSRRENIATEQYLTNAQQQATNNQQSEAVAVEQTTTDNPQKQTTVQQTITDTNTVESPVENPTIENLAEEQSVSESATDKNHIKEKNVDENSVKEEPSAQQSVQTSIDNLLDGAPATLSLKNLKKNAEANNNIGSPLKEITSGSDEITQERLLDVWVKMAESEKNSPKLYTTVSQTKPVLRGNIIVFYVKNELQKNWIEQQRKQKFLVFLKENLNNNDIDLQIEVVEDSGNGDGKLYMPQEKAKFLIENYPEVKELRDDLNLELK
jgi:DNA polymerase III, subunit gamma and tau